ncbi:multidrug transporter [Ventosimonas gracilis]|uniref:Multidrug transporter n=1 Tax=Ventosimonas gracilis TaxID=1680762 RepID=A0A139SR13_9GAMM|nr:efflux transporter outer membrane subunit [Ventosimonas gracilis]KXU36891.1 multidrug transporter [Ventosimonas gracilis]
MKKSLLSLAIALAVSGCSLIPEYIRPNAPQETESHAIEGWQASNWQSFFVDPTLRRLISQALANNRDLRAASLNVEAYQALYRIQRADRFPGVNGSGSGIRQRIPERASPTGQRQINSQYSATIAASWELDLFGRVKSLQGAALEQYLASEATRQSLRISLIVSVAEAWFAWQADQALLDLARETLQAWQDSYALTERSVNAGVASSLTLAQAKSQVESARVRRAQYQRQVQQDLNALTLLLGSQLPADLDKPLDLNGTLLGELPAALPSNVLQNRPDILAAEHQLKAANANIGAARAAFFPNISLTAAAGTLSPDLSGLFRGNSGTWLFQPQISVPIFNAGSLKASLDYAKLQKDMQIAQYEKAIQSAFREVADGLIARTSYRDQLAAQRDLVAANQDYYQLAERRYQTGIDSNLTFLDAQRQLFSAQQTLIADRLAQLSAEVQLYKALGGGFGDSE